MLFVVAIMGLSGCATNRGLVDIHLPEGLTRAEANGKEVYIASVIDERIFEEKPTSQDIPSLGFGGAENAPAEIKKRAIARKRNGFGQAIGDILLKEGQNVETVIAEALERSFLETGYTIIGNRENITEKTIMVNATIQKFWAYMTPGFWAITLSSDISTNLEIKENETKTKMIAVHSDGNFQVASGANWMKVIDLSIQKYIAEVKKEI